MKRSTRWVVDFQSNDSVEPLGRGRGVIYRGNLWHLKVSILSPSSWRRRLVPSKHKSSGLWNRQCSQLESSPLEVSRSTLPWDQDVNRAEKPSSGRR